MAKRAAVQIGAVAKRTKVDPMMAGVMEAVDSAKGLNDICRSMLRAACPLALGLVAEKRHDAHRDVVSMIGEVLAGSVEDLENTVTVAKSRIVEVEAKKCDLERAVEVLTTELNSGTEALQAAKRELEVASVASAAVDKVFKESLEAQKKCEKETEIIRAEKSRLESVIKNHLEPVQLEDLDEPTSKKHAQALLGLAQWMDLDEAMLAALPKVVTRAKANRGAFDVMALDALAEALRLRLSSVEERLKQVAPGVDACAEALAEAARGVEAASGTKSVREAAVAAAATVEAERRRQLHGSETAVRMASAEVKTTLKESETAGSALDEFKAWPLECFKMLRDKVAVADAAGA